MRHGEALSRGWVSTLAVVIFLCFLVINGCSGGLNLEDPIEVFEQATGSASLAENPPSDLAAYLPLRDPASFANWPQSEALVSGDISNIKLRFGFDRIEAPGLMGSKPADQTGSNDIRVYELSISRPRLIAGDFSLPKELCVLALVSNVLAREGDISALIEADTSRVWLPITSLSGDKSVLPANEPEVKESAADGCVLLQESAVLRLSPDGTLVERIGAWTAAIDSLEGKKLSSLGDSIEELEVTIKARR